MNSKYDASMSFNFINNGVKYSYNGKTNEVSGKSIRDTIKYMPSSVDAHLRNGAWKVIGAQLEFPRASIYAKLDGYEKVYIVGPATMGNGWGVEYKTGAINKVRAVRLTEIDDRDEQAFTIVSDLGVSFYQALKMVDKGYGKL